ncbi:MAG: S8 family serine peptidase [Candidatus Asgardarchaeia archaeon]
MCTGKNIKIAILDSGAPQHKDIKIGSEKLSFCQENINVYDKNGHATIVSGIVKANNKKSIVGLAPNAQLLFGKIIDNHGMCDFNSLVAGVLWAIVKEVDIIVMALGTQYDYRVLHDAIKKAKNYNICIFAASGDKKIDKNWEIDYPARYKEVFSTGFLTRSKIKNNIIREKTDFYLPNKSLFTTYIDDKYVRASGSSVATAFFAGLAAVLVEHYKKEGRRDIPEKVYASLLKTIK